MWEGEKWSLRNTKKVKRWVRIPEEYTTCPGVAMGLCDGLSHCKLALAFAVLMDLLGGTALLVGVFVPLNIKGRDFGDLLVYTGALFVLMSLGGWVLWAVVAGHKSRLSVYTLVGGCKTWIGSIIPSLPSH
ncbi:hypothetical protein J4Q44_G00030290 [Coregonus suidteri]|uniref:Transmembrane protein 238 n=1 Tax=Coregonus suidteri TaxID=861788 RepID=A0AAN8MBU1_9TELE